METFRRPWAILCTHLCQTLALLFVFPAVIGLISNVSNLCRRRPEDYDIHNSRKKPRIDYPPEFHQRPG